MSYLLILFILGTSVFLPFCFYKPVEHKTFFVCYFTVLSAHIIAAAIQSSGHILPGADQDAMRFYLYGKEVAETGIFKHFWAEADLFDNLVGLLFMFGGVSMFLGCMTSVLAFCLFFVLLYKLLLSLKVPCPHIIIAAITVLYAFSPSTLIFTSVIMREPWEILLISVCVYSSYMFSIRPRLIYPVIILATLTAMFVLHNAFSLLSYILPLSVILPFNHDKDDNNKNFFAFPFPAVRIITALLITLYVVIVPSELSQTNPAFQNLRVVREVQKGTLEKYADNQRNNLQKARSYYDARLDYTDAGAFVYSASNIVLSYMFRPLPSEIEDPKDWYAFGESILRLMLLVTYFSGFIFMTRRERALSLFLGFHYGLLTCLWAAGTNNWGTAVRHHITHQWLLVIIAGMAAIAIYRRIKYRDGRTVLLSR